MRRSEVAAVVLVLVAAGSVVYVASQASSRAVPYVTILGSLAVAAFTAVVTAVTTNRRQERQLAHDRQMRDLESARLVLDQTIETWDRAMTVFVNHDGSPSAREEMENEAWSLTFHRSRLAMRFSKDHRLVVLFSYGVDWYWGGLHEQEQWSWPLSEECIKRRREITGALSGNWGAFSRVAFETIGLRIGPGPLPEGGPHAEREVADAESDSATAEGSN